LYWLDAVMSASGTIAFVDTPRLSRQLSSKYLLPDDVDSALLIVDFVLIRHVLVELSNSNDLQIKEASDRQFEAQVSGSLLDNTLLSLPDM